MLTLADCDREIRELHTFFVEYYTGKRSDFERLENALGADFALVHPSGEITDREAVLGGIRDSYNSHETGEFDIEIRNVEPVELREERALVRYEEWQHSPDGTSGRLSTAYFAPPNGERSPREEGSASPAAEWRYLQETWLDAPEE